MQSSQIQKVFLSQHAKSWYSHENIVTERRVYMAPRHVHTGEKTHA